MAVDGPIALAARGYIPELWDALASSTFYGDTLIGSKVNYVKFALFGTVVDASDEQNVYNPLYIEYIAKGVALTLIPGGADFYANKMIAMVATGTNESKTWPDRIASLWHIHARLLKEMEDLKGVIVAPGGFTRNRALPSNTGAGLALKGANPDHYPALQATWYRGHNALPWERWTGPS